HPARRHGWPRLRESAATGQSLLANANSRRRRWWLRRQVCCETRCRVPRPEVTEKRIPRKSPPAPATFLSCALRADADIPPSARWSQLRVARVAVQDGPLFLPQMTAGELHENVLEARLAGGEVD